MDLPIEEYYAHALKMSERELEIRDEIIGWLPDEIIDAHAHCNLKEHVHGVDPRARGHMLSTFPYFPLEMSKQLHEMFFPGKRIRSLRFPKTFRGIDHRSANQYLLQNSPEADRIALFGLPEDVAYTNAMLAHPRVSALKMYWSYVDPTAKTIYEFFKPEILEESQARDIPIVLHLPRVLVASINDLLRVVKDFPQQRIVLAHLGLSKMVIQGLEETIKTAAAFDNVFMDTALNPSAEVMSLALKCFGRERILFGSDEPLNLIRSVAYRHPQKGERIVTDFKYHWVDSDEVREYGHLAQNATHAHWQSMLAIKRAVELLPKNQQEVTKVWIFRKAAEAVYNF